ncbi:MAG TPA: septum formation initiator family protein [Candidatus Bacteroides intestinavium]|jgi:cell division protein FtsB|uniref:Septum formation initiator family protein n=1 Tax=Candidatus Bacteroides intestinavium TaxID=2838469 RepID=A0A9D2HUG5_9BACE|nr:septum formation initiator family protein [Candidatus Bacteroides intestinavium]
MDKLSSLWSFIGRHKYAITLAAFAIFVGFFDQNSLLRRANYMREESRLLDEIKKYRQEYEKNTERLNELLADSGAIERIAREKYFMKKPNEDIYVFEEDITE